MTKKNDDKQKGQKSGGDQTAGRQGARSDANQQQSYNQGGHAGTSGHAGQQSGGMGGQHGGALHDVGSGQSGMTGRGGMGGNESGNQQPGSPRRQQPDNPGSQQQGGQMGTQEPAEYQQSAQREGMGSHQHSNRENENALDAASDVDDLGSQSAGAGKAREDKPRR